MHGLGRSLGRDPVFGPGFHIPILWGVRVKERAFLFVSTSGPEQVPN